MKSTVPTPSPRRHWLIPIPSALAVIFIVCALAAPQQKFVAIWCTMAACAIVTTVFMLCLQLVLADIALHAAPIHARLDAIEASAEQTTRVLEGITGALGKLPPALHTGPGGAEFADRLAHVEGSVSRLRKLLSAQVTADLTYEDPDEGPQASTDSDTTTSS